MLALIIALVCVFIDQLTKIIVLNTLKGQKPVVLIENLLSFVYVENRGAAFGILQNKQFFFILVTIVSVLIIGYILIFHYKKLSTFMIFILGLILGGTIGNFIDRIRLGFVVDFISVRILNRFNFAVFNLADSFIVVGAILLMLYILFFEGKSTK